MIPAPSVAPAAAGDAAAWGRRLSLLPWLAVLAFLILYPIALLVFGSFSSESPRTLTLSPRTFTLDNYRHILGNGGFHAALATTVVASVWGALLAVAIGLLFAWLVARSDFPGKGLLETVVLVPFFVSPLMGAIAWSVLGSRYGGLLNLALQRVGVQAAIDVNTMLGVIFVSGIYYAPYAYLLLVSALSNIDVSLEEAANVTGAGGWTTFWRIVLPLARPAILSGLLLVFVTLLSQYAIPFVIGEPGHLTFLTSYLWRVLLQSPADYQAAAVLSTLLIAIALAGLAVQGRLLRGRTFSVIGGRGHRLGTTRLGGWGYAAGALVVGYVLLAIVLPYFAVAEATFRNFLFFRSIGDLFSVRTLTTDNAMGLFARPIMRHSIENSLAVGLLVAVGGTALSVAIAYLMQRSAIAGRQVLGWITMLPIAVPSLVIGVAYLWAWISAPIALYGTLWILVLAYISQLLPNGVQGISANLVQIDRSLEEAAAACGSSTWQAVSAIVLPLLRPGIASVLFLLFIVTIREIGPSLFLYNSGTVVMAVQVLSSWEVGDLGGAAALSLLQSVLLTAVVLFGRHILRIRLRMA